MVVIQIKTSDQDSFLYETTCDTTNDALVRDITRVWNMRLRLEQLTGALREMAKYGPMKHPNKAGLDEISETYNGETVEKGAYYQPDPTGARTGNGVGPQLSETIERVVLDTESALSQVNTTRKIATSLAMLQEKLDTIRGVTIMAYPMGLPDWDTVRLTIEGNEGLEGTGAGMHMLDEDTAELWVASRIFDRSAGQTVADRLGRNEKTKVVGKLQRPGGGPPGREPGVSEDEKKAMMAFYFKKQEEAKRMAESSEDDYLHSSWADPKALQRSMRGQSNVKAPGLR
mmetsp:Transcript_49985/g.87282  ORF Transcript_49985/g.87282 Transcript_49985/m.87282 type:complete len:286 (-) Transcript_49985:137-994(-)|eukprot:CAMPEP_0184977012 /NCGR_PEP_ID=MMETSP1098-20130426/7807_1 /TAXON_ID=89044 /ORGANISM="Spumella elongata, Strain CCAP 955/1" /LENGTH=285 /DNA_ID=CAMNT_0027499957 /DNA_START=46 /DNA_END=903 /DNA_ORIENTATION=+